MTLFYDRDYGRNWNRGYDRGYRGHRAWGDFEGGYDYGRGPSGGFGAYRGTFGRGPHMSGNRYDMGYKSRWQTDFGDPFNDRGSHTPFRMSRGEYRGGAGRNFGWNSNYDRDFSANPMGYDPYYDQSRGTFSGRSWNRYDRGMGRGYDEGWF